MCTKYHGQTYYYQATMLVIAINFFVVVIYCYHGDGNDGWHVCKKFHSHTYYYQQLIGCYVGNCVL